MSRMHDRRATSGTRTRAARVRTAWYVRAVPRVMPAIAVLALFFEEAAAEPNDFVARPLVLERGEIEASLTVEINLKARLVGKPLSLAPDLWVERRDSEVRAPRHP